MGNACTENFEPFFFHYNFCVNIKRQEFKDGASLGTSLRVPNIIKILLFIFLPKWLLPGGLQLCFLHFVQQWLQINVLCHQNSYTHLCQMQLSHPIIDTAQRRQSLKPQVLDILGNQPLPCRKEQGGDKAAVKQNLVVTAVDPNKISFMLLDTSPNLFTQSG